MKMKIGTASPRFENIASVLAGIEKVLKTGRLMNGEFTREFEKIFSDYLGVPFCVSVNSCTTALEITLKYLGVAQGEVIIPTNTFIATGNAVIYAGGKPVLADIKDGTYFLDPLEVERLFSANTRAVIAVHIAGYVPPEIEELREICEARKIPLIEDCAHAAGASYNGKKAGTFGFAGCYSFYPTKIITTGTGGMITTRDAGLAKYASSAKLHGAGEGGLSEVVNLGNDWFMDEIRAVLGVNQMESIESFVARRREVAAIYDSLVKNTGLMKKFPISSKSVHSYYKYPVQVAEWVDVADMKMGFQDKYGFELESVYWPTCHLQPVYRNLFGMREGMFPAAEKILSKQVTLPMHPGVASDEAHYAFDCLVSEINLRRK